MASRTSTRPLRSFPTTSNHRLWGRLRGRHGAGAHVPKLDTGWIKRVPAPVAQGTEQRFPKPCVAGSSPARGTHLFGLFSGITCSGPFPRFTNVLLGLRHSLGVGEELREVDGRSVEVTRADVVHAVYRHQPVRVRPSLPREPGADSLLRHTPRAWAASRALG